MPEYSFDTVIFDLDGVVTKTARIHTKSWKTMFDKYLRMRKKKDGEPFCEFTYQEGYLRYVDGRPRYQGVKSFLESRGINIPYGDPSDKPDKETICGLGNKRNNLFLRMLKQEGAEIFPTSVALIEKLKSAGIRIGVASSSKSCKAILKSAGLHDLLKTSVGGLVSAELGLKGKPEGDIFVAAAGKTGSKPERAMVVEDAASGVAAGRNGGFGLVVGVARRGNEAELLASGADVVVRDLAEINIEWIEKWFQRKVKPLFESWESKENVSFEPDPQYAGCNVTVNPCYTQSAKQAFFNGKRLVFFLDYDGTLTPIVERPELARISDDMRDIVTHLARLHTVAIVSGRMREDVQNLAGIKDIFYAGNHGFDILGPGFSMVHPKAQEMSTVIAEVIKRLSNQLGDIQGLLIEEKRFSAAMHYRLVDEKKYFSKIKSSVNKIMRENKSLRLMSGKKVFELMPNINWNKGQAIRWIMQALGLSWPECAVIYIGDDVTDEFAFRTIRTRGTGILVSDNLKISAADFCLFSTEEVRKLFEKVIAESS
ncbi:MAG: trehalose-phosphatase [Candidatus Omnitrophota bacterium]